MIPRVLFLLCSLGIALAPAADTVIPLWPEGVPDQNPEHGPEQNDNGWIRNVHTPTLTLFAPASGQANGTAIVICPGGSYTVLASRHEGDDLARWMNARGVTAFVLKYRLKEYGQPAPLRDVLRALRIVRSRADEFGVRHDRIGIMGSSAGGHLAASAATLYAHDSGRTGADLDAINARPDFAVLLYPVITMDATFTHAGSRENLLGPNAPEELVHLYSLEKQVTAATPPTFIFYTQADETVPVRNGVEFFSALTRAGVPAELHVFERGRHGIGMSAGHGPASEWPPLLEAWMRMHGWIE